jgi:cell division protein FtsQ
MSATLSMPPGRRIGGTPLPRTAAPPRVPVRVLAALFALLAVPAGLLHLFDPETLPIRRVRVSGEFLHLSPAELQSGAEDVVRGGFFNVNVADIQRRLAADPWVAAVAVRRQWPDGIDVQVTERRPVAHWGEDALLDEHRTRFAPPSQTFPPGLPRLSGPVGSETAVLEMLARIEQRIAGGELRVAALTLNPRRSWSFTLAGGPRVVLGRSEVAARLERFAVALDTELRPQLAAIAAIDTRYTNGLAVRWRQAQGGIDLTNATSLESHGQEE